MTTPGKKVRLGLIGAGWWATSNHLPVLAGRDDVELMAVCRLGQEPLRQVKERFGFAFATEDYRELLDRCELDAAVAAVQAAHNTNVRSANAGLRVGTSG